LGKTGDRCFSAGPQDFFWLNGEFIRRRLRALLMRHANVRQDERLFKVTNDV
jgi:hypothetical protein